MSESKKKRYQRPQLRQCTAVQPGTQASLFGTTPDGGGTTPSYSWTYVSIP